MCCCKLAAIARAKSPSSSEAGLKLGLLSLSRFQPTVFCWSGFRRVINVPFCSKKPLFGLMQLIPSCVPDVLPLPFLEREAIESSRVFIQVGHKRRLDGVNTFDEKPVSCQTSVSL